MSLNPVCKFYFTASAPLITSGALAAWYGISKVLHYIEVTSTDESGIAYDSKELIFPYLCLFLGVGGAVFGCIYLIKGLMLNSKKRS